MLHVEVGVEKYMISVSKSLVDHWSVALPLIMELILCSKEFLMVRWVPG